jgi:hypothetical protein
MAGIKIISPSRTQLVNKEGLLLPIRFEYKKSIYETYEPYFIVRMIARSKGTSIKKLLLSELLGFLRGRKIKKRRKNAK